MERILEASMGIEQDDITDTTEPIAMRLRSSRRRKSDFVPDKQNDYSEWDDLRRHMYYTEDDDDTVHSTIRVEPYMAVFDNAFIRWFLYVYFVLTFGSVAYETYNSAIFAHLSDAYIANALTPNLPFCETPFASTQYMAQGASALAHLPYVPALLLGISYASSEIMPTVEQHRGLLWTQFALQLYTSVCGHMLPNPSAVFCQEISIGLAFVLLYQIFLATTSETAKQQFAWTNVVLFIATCLAGYLILGLMPIVFMSFAIVMVFCIAFPDAFGLITPYGRHILLRIFGLSVCVLALETAGCDWLNANIGTDCPYHLLFDLLFWQVLGSAVDVVILSPAGNLRSSP
jgi:hypothetical protein